jgi:uncharacterized Tic20 family protein
MTDQNPESLSNNPAQPGEPSLPEDALPNAFAAEPPREPQPPAADVVIDAAWQPGPAAAEPTPASGQPAAQPGPAGPQPLSSQDERTWAMLSHLTILINLFTGILGPFAALIIYLVFRGRSRYVAFHSLQSFIWQLVIWYGFGILAAILWILSVILLPFIGLGCLCMPLALLATLAPVAGLVYGLIAAIQTNSGQDFRYPWIGNWVQSMI